MIWELALRLGGQIRVVGHMGGISVLGWDMTAALALAKAMDLSGWLVAEMLPEIEAVMVRKMRKDG